MPTSPLTGDEQAPIKSATHRKVNCTREVTTAMLDGEEPGHVHDRDAGEESKCTCGRRETPASQRSRVDLPDDLRDGPGCYPKRHGRPSRREREPTHPRTQD